MKRILYCACIALVMLVIGFALSSGLAHDFLSKAITGIKAEFKYYLERHCSSFWVYPFQNSRWHYFLLPEGAYTATLYTAPLSLSTIATVLLNSLFNVLFQPLFLCVLTPQTVFNCLLFPFFLYGAVKYFKRIYVMIFVLLGMYVYIGIYSSVVEPIIRHRMSCELIYLLIGLAGFISLITGRSSS